MTTYADLQNRVARLVSDPDITTYTDEIYLDAIQAAHDAILPWVPNYCTATITYTSGSSGVYALPDDVYDVQSVRIGTGAYIPKATLASGTTRPTSLTACDWIETPKGYLSISAWENVTEDLVVNYLGFWAKPTVSASIIQVPQYAHMGMVYYAASIVVTPVVVDISTLGPFKIRVESGTPEDNPMMRTSEWFRNLFLQEMKMMPPYQKARA
jgi:hypothetical protein